MVDTSVHLKITHYENHIDQDDQYDQYDQYDTWRHEQASSILIRDDDNLEEKEPSIDPQLDQIFDHPICRPLLISMNIHPGRLKSIIYDEERGIVVAGCKEHINSDNRNDHGILCLSPRHKILKENRIPGSYDDVILSRFDEMLIVHIADSLGWESFPNGESRFVIANIPDTVRYNDLSGRKLSEIIDIPCLRPLDLEITKSGPCHWGGSFIWVNGPAPGLDPSYPI